MDAGIVRGKVWQMAQSPHSTWVLQSVLQDAAGGDAERVQLAHELKGHVWEAMRCPYANHVLQKCLVLVHARANQFMVDELLMEGPGAVVNAARHLSEDEAQGMCDSLATISDQLEQTVVGRRLLRLCDRHQPPEP